MSGANLIPGGFTLNVWTPYSGGLSFLPYFDKTGNAAFYFKGPIAGGYNAMFSPAITVEPGQILNLTGYVDASAVTSGHVVIGVFTAIGPTNQNYILPYLYTTGNDSVFITIPANVTKIYVGIGLQNTTLNAGTFFASLPSLTLAGFSYTAVEAPFSPTPFKFNFTAGAIPVWSNGKELLIAVNTGNGEPQGFMVIKIRPEGVCVFCSDNLSPYQPHYNNSNSITFDGKTFRTLGGGTNYSNGFFEFTVPHDFKAGTVYKFPLVSKGIPQNPCGGNGDVQNVYLSGGQYIIEYIKDFPLDSEIFATIYPTNDGVNYGFIAQGAPDPLFTGVSSALATSLVPRVPTNFVHDSSYYVMQIGPPYAVPCVAESVNTSLEYTLGISCTENNIQIKAAPGTAINLQNLDQTNALTYGVFASADGFFGFDQNYGAIWGYSSDGVNLYKYQSSIAPAYSYGGNIGFGFLNGVAYQILCPNNGALRVFISNSTLPLIGPDTNVGLRHNLLINSARPISIGGKFIT